MSSVNNTELIIESLNHAKILNGLFRAGVTVKKCKKEIRRLTLTVDSSDMRKVKEYLEEYEYHYVIVAERGVLHTSKRFLSRYGLIAGLIVALVLLIGASTLVFDIEITGLENVQYSSIENILSAKEIEKYSLKRNIDIDSLRMDINKIEGVASVSVSIKGTKLLINVKEELQKGIVPIFDDSGIYAECDTIITRIIVQSGTAMVKAGDSVRKGALLIAPFYTLNEDTILPVAARGEIYGRQ
ncbi:MAG: hypothetical protein EOM87_07440 [Clostridia bacterium]|nr:hypothetical protein [Clostridia bacterium]